MITHEPKSLYELHEEFTSIKHAINYLMECHNTMITHGFKDGTPSDEVLDSMGNGITFLNEMVMEKMERFQNELWDNIDTVKGANHDD